MLVVYSTPINDFILARCQYYFIQISSVLNAFFGSVLPNVYLANLGFREAHVINPLVYLLSMVAACWFAVV